MTPATIGLLALGMSVDAFAAAMAQGAAQRRLGLRALLATGLTFGVIEALTPLIGWALGLAASYYVAAIDHWVAFVLLTGVGLHTVLEALRRPPHTPASGRTSWLGIAATAVGTSLDAMAVGVTLAFLDAPILTVALAIGLTTMAMTMLGMGLGRALGQRFGKIMEIIGGSVIILIGITILAEHLTA